MGGQVLGRTGLVKNAAWLGGVGKGVSGGRKTDPWEPRRKHLTHPGGKTVENMILAGETSADCR